jgi:nicotinamide mononucleotide transporter
VTALRELFAWLQHESVTVAGYPLPWIEVVGNLFGFASAILGMRRRVWAWPIGIIGNLLLFMIFVSATFDADSRTPLFGQAGRQVFFIMTSLYGWWRWQEHRNARLAAGAPADTPAITPRWATSRERVGYVLVWIGGVLVAQWALASIGAAWPAPRWYFWCDAWILVGSMLATYAMARGWNEFWLMWIAVDLVGVPLLWHSEYYATAILYAVYGVLVLYGFFVWLKASRTEAPDRFEARELDPVG